MQGLAALEPKQELLLDVLLERTEDGETGHQFA